MHRALSRLAIIAMLAVAAGCGEDAVGDKEVSQGSGQDYGEVLHGLRDAAMSESTYGAARRAKSLPPPERAAIKGFCEMVWQIDVNEEAAKLSLHPYIDNRLKGRAAIELEGSSDALEAAVGELSKVVGLQHLDGKLDSSYKKACYR